MSSPSDPQPPVDPEGRVQHSTQEIPVVQPTGAPDAHGATKLPPHPGATAPSPVAMDEPQPTGPVDFVPGLPGTPPVPPPTAPAPPPPVPPIATEEPPTNPARVWPETLADDEAPARAKKRRVQGPRNRAAVLGLVAFAAAYPSGSRLRTAAVWRVAAAGLVGLAVFWLLVVLPVVASDRGFLLTAALGALGGALWVGPGRTR